MKRLLLIEDSKVDAMEAQAAIESKSPGEFQFIVCQTIEEALQKLESETFDVISLDLNLPDAERLTGLIRLQEHARNTPLVVMTGQNEPALALEAIILGAQDFVVKGVSSYGDLLARVLNHAIERKKLNSLSLQAIEIEHRVLNDVLRQSQFVEVTDRLSSKLQRDEFVAALAHDVKNPLVGEQQVLTGILSGGKNVLPPLYYDSLLSLRRSNQSLLLTLSNLIDVYSIEAGDREFVFENVNLIGTIDEVIENFKYIIESAEITIAKHDFPESFVVKLDVTAFVRIFSNLLHNACKFGKKGSVINLYLQSDSEKFQFEIESIGAAIREENKPILFKRFKRSLLGQEYLHSSGLGLYLCKRLVDGHKGTIECISNGDVTKLIVGLPRISDDT